MYAVKEYFTTLQGEGYWTGTPSLFIRFAGCNLWSGREEHRERDAARNRARCPRWCDTDFVDGVQHTAAQLAELVRDANMPHLVFTGGEPFLQLDEELIDAVRLVKPDVRVAVETNGTVVPGAPVDWVCVSPKRTDAETVLRNGDELKLVFPAYDPNDYADLAEGFDHLFVSPEAMTSAVGVSLIAQDNVQRAVRFCLENPSWRLSQQTHKSLGLR